VAHAAEEGDLVLFKLHPGAAAIAEAPAREGIAHCFTVHRDSGGQTFKNSYKGGAMRFARGQPTQHVHHFAMTCTH